MSAGTERTRTVWLCHTDALYTGAGHPLTLTYFDYDREGKISGTLKEFNYRENKTSATGIAIRQTDRDEFGIIVSEMVFGEDGVPFEMLREIVYEKDETGLVRRVIEVAKDASTKERFGIIRYIDYDHHHPYRRGLVSRIRHLTPEGDFAYEYQYKYDDHGEKTHIYGQSAPEEPKRLLSERFIDYDDHGNPIRYQKNQPYFIQNTYDDNGRLQQAVVWEKDEKARKWDLSYQHRYTYEEYEVVIPKVFPFPK